MGSTKVQPVASGRLFDVDWLRVLATALIFVYHCGRVFDAMEPWHIKNRDLTEALIYPMAIGSQFMMPLFWVLSGIGTYLAMRTHPIAEFARGRARRLLVPVVTVGWFVLCPPQVYIESVTDQQYNAPAFQGTFWEFLPHYVSGGVYGFGGWFALTGLHLWYLAYLALFTLASLPLFRLLLGHRGRTVTASLAGFLDRPGAIFLLALPVLLPEVLLPPGIPILTWDEGGWNLGSHWMFLVLGFVIASEPGIREAIERQRWASLSIAVVTLIPLAIWAPGMGDLGWGDPTYFAQFAWRTINGWLWLLAILGFGSRHLNRPHPILAVVGEAVLPFYVLHQTVIVVLGYAGRDWPLPIAAKYPLLIVAALAICVALYALVVRPFAPARFLFGLPSSVAGGESRRT